MAIKVMTTMNLILDKYSIIFSFFYRINRRYYKTAHLSWTNANCFIVSSGFIATLIFTFIYVLNISISSESLINIALSILVLVSLFVGYYNSSRKDFIETLKQEKEPELTMGMKAVHFVSIVVSFILPKLLYPLCLGQELVW